MSARTSNILRRLDRWLLLRAPLLWRTRLPYLLILLSLAVIAAHSFMQTEPVAEIWTRR
jgi:hypothetical protein